MLGDTLVLPHADGNITLNKINQDGYSSEYLWRDSGSQVVARVRHTKVKATPTRQAMDRHNVEIVQTIFATDETAAYDKKVYVVFENLASDSDVKFVDALCDWLIASANAKVVALMGWQS